MNKFYIILICFSFVTANFAAEIQDSLFIINNTDSDYHLRIRTGSDPDIMRFTPGGDFHGYGLSVRLPQNPLIGSNIPASVGFNHETFKFPKRSVIRIPKDHVIKNLLRMRFWPTDFYPSIDVKNNKPVDSSEINIKNSVRSVLLPVGTTKSIIFNDIKQNPIIMPSFPEAFNKYPKYDLAAEGYFVQ